MHQITSAVKLIKRSPQAAKIQLKWQSKQLLLFPLVFSAWLVSTAAATALPSNLSDNTGTNVWNNTAPIFAPDRLVDPEIISTARQFSQSLDDAYRACVASANAAANAPRRFARGTEAPNVVCNSPECQRLNSLINESRTFLNGLDSSQLQQLRASDVRVW